MTRKLTYGNFAPGWKVAVGYEMKLMLGQGTQGEVYQNHGLNILLTPPLEPDLNKIDRFLRLGQTLHLQSGTEHCRYHQLSAANPGTPYCLTSSKTIAAKLLAHHDQPETLV